MLRPRDELYDTPDRKESITVHALTPSTRNPSAAARILLAAGIAAGPVYVLVGLVEAFTRSGFDLTRHCSAC